MPPSLDPRRSERLVSESLPDGRTPGQIDRDRILYSTAFSRLAEVTQVVSAERGHVFHNRLTHSLKVGQLARRMAERLLRIQPAEALSLGIDPDVAEAAGLAHDLGHPPFGHVAEKELDQLVTESQPYGLKDGFEGNAQSFRIVTRLTDSDAADQEGGTVAGLNLTRATLNAMLKYPWLRGDNPRKLEKWGAYETEREIFDWVRHDLSFEALGRSVEAELMDWADDITFAIHDLVDFYRVGQIPVDRLLEPTSERESFFEEVFSRNPGLQDKRAQYESAFAAVVDLLGLERAYVGSDAQRKQLWQISTALISRFVESISLTTSGHDPRLLIRSEARHEIRMLKELTWHYVILRPGLAMDQHGKQTVIRSLYSIFLREAANPTRSRLFPIQVLDRLRAPDAQPARIVADYIAAMSEREAQQSYRLVQGYC